LGLSQSTEFNYNTKEKFWVDWDGVLGTGTESESVGLDTRRVYEYVT